MFVYREVLCHGRSAVVGLSSSRRFGVVAGFPPFFS